MLAIPFSTTAASAQSYTTQLPAGMKQQTAPFNAVLGPKPTHRFWAAKNWFPANLTAQGDYTMFPEPLAVQAMPKGLLVGYSPNLVIQSTYFIHPVQMDFIIGTAGLNSETIPVSRYSDWTVDLNFGSMTTTLGRGMPFVYVTTRGSNPVVTFKTPFNIIRNAGNALAVSSGANSYGLFCPTGGTWSQSGLTLTCHLPPGKHYASAALLPDLTAFDLYRRFAFSFPVNTTTTWAYEQQSSKVTTTLTVVTKAMEGDEEGFLQALYPHQYASLAQPSSLNTQFAYTSARGPMKILNASAFTTKDTYHGILPFLPTTQDAQEQRTLAKLLVDLRGAPTLFPASDTYALGKELAAAGQALILAQSTGDAQTSSLLQEKLRMQFQRWFAGSPVPPTFYYDKQWGTLIGYPASFGSDVQLNDHHFHYGYWIEAASLLGLADPAWMTSNRTAVSLLARDIATPVRDDPMFPFLRHFDVYAGHSWASGQAPFGDGENEESSSEAVNAWAALILFASETGDTALRDTAIWMYTLETNAVFDYWFNDGPVRTFPAGFQRTQIANLFDGKADAATWFGNDAAFEHGVEYLPFTGGSLYLGRDNVYARRNLAEVTGPSGKIDPAPARWPDLMAMYEAFFDPQRSLTDLRSTTFVFDGETRAHEYAWMTSFKALGEVDASITANTTFYAVFRSHDGNHHHIAFNLARSPLKVTFSDGATITVAPQSYAVDQRIIPLRPR